MSDGMEKNLGELESLLADDPAENATASMFRNNQYVSPQSAPISQAIPGRNRHPQQQQPPSNQPPQPNQPHPPPQAPVGGPNSARGRGGALVARGRGAGGVVRPPGAPSAPGAHKPPGTNIPVNYRPELPNAAGRGAFMNTPMGGAPNARMPAGRGMINGPPKPMPSPTTPGTTKNYFELEELLKTPEAPPAALPNYNRPKQPVMSINPQKPQPPANFNKMQPNMPPNNARPNPAMAPNRPVSVQPMPTGIPPASTPSKYVAELESIINSSDSKQPSPIQTPKGITPQPQRQPQSQPQQEAKFQNAPPKAGMVNRPGIMINNMQNMTGKVFEHKTPTPNRNQIQTPPVSKPGTRPGVGINRMMQSQHQPPNAMSQSHPPTAPGVQQQAPPVQQLQQPQQPQQQQQKQTLVSGQQPPPSQQPPKTTQEEKLVAHFCHYVIQRLVNELKNNPEEKTKREAELKQLIKVHWVSWRQGKITKQIFLDSIIGYVRSKCPPLEKADIFAQFRNLFHEARKKQEERNRLQSQGQAPPHQQPGQSIQGHQPMQPPQPGQPTSALSKGPNFVNQGPLASRQLPTQSQPNQVTQAPTQVITTVENMNNTTKQNQNKNFNQSHNNNIVANGNEVLTENNVSKQSVNAKESNARPPGAGPHAKNAVKKEPVRTPTGSKSFAKPKAPPAKSVPSSAQQAANVGTNDAITSSPPLTEENAATPTTGQKRPAPPVTSEGGAQPPVAKKAKPTKPKGPAPPRPPAKTAQKASTTPKPGTAPKPPASKGTGTGTGTDTGSTATATATATLSPPATDMETPATSPILANVNSDKKPPTKPPAKPPAPAPAVAKKRKATEEDALDIVRTAGIDVDDEEEALAMDIEDEIQLGVQGSGHDRDHNESMLLSYSQVAKKLGMFVKNYELEKYEANLPQFIEEAVRERLSNMIERLVHISRARNDSEKQTWSGLGIQESGPNIGKRLQEIGKDEERAIDVATELRRRKLAEEDAVPGVDEKGSHRDSDNKAEKGGDKEGGTKKANVSSTDKLAVEKKRQEESMKLTNMALSSIMAGVRKKRRERKPAPTGVSSGSKPAIKEEIAPVLEKPVVNESSEAIKENTIAPDTKTPLVDLFASPIEPIKKEVQTTEISLQDCLYFMERERRSSKSALLHKWFTRLGQGQEEKKSDLNVNTNAS